MTRGCGALTSPYVDRFTKPIRNHIVCPELGLLHRGGRNHPGPGRSAFVHPIRRIRRDMEALELPKTVTDGFDPRCRRLLSRLVGVVELRRKHF